jgi:hypothetical protein
MSINGINNNYLLLPLLKQCQWNKIPWLFSIFFFLHFLRDVVYTIKSCTIGACNLKKITAHVILNLSYFLVQDYKTLEFLTVILQTETTHF